MPTSAGGPPEKGTALGKVILQIKDARVEAALGGVVPEHVPVDGDVVVTDAVGVAAVARCPVAFLGVDLPSVIKVITDYDVGGVLAVRDVRSDQLAAVARGCRVYSALDHQDLSLEEGRWRMVALRSNGVGAAEIGKSVGYSGRHIRRVLSRFVKRADLRNDFEWTQLGPLFPMPKPGALA